MFNFLFTICSFVLIMFLTEYWRSNLVGRLCHLIMLTYPFLINPLSPYIIQWLTLILIPKKFMIVLYNNVSIQFCIWFMFIFPSLLLLHIVLIYKLFPIYPFPSLFPLCPYFFYFNLFSPMPLYCLPISPIPPMPLIPSLFPLFLLFPPIPPYSYYPFFRFSTNLINLLTSILHLPFRFPDHMVLTRWFIFIGLFVFQDSEINVVESNSRQKRPHDRLEY